MRIVHVTEVNSGGVRGLLGSFAADQVNRGFDVHVVGDATLADFAGTHHLWRGSRRRPGNLVGDWTELRRILGELSPDVVHLHSFFAGAFGRVGPVARRRFPVVYQPHSWAFDAARARGTRAAIVRFERWAGRRTDFIATNSQDEIDEGRSQGIRAAAVALGVPVDLEWFTPVGVDERRSLRTKLRFGNRAALVCMGRLVRQKGYDILVRAWEREPIPGAAVYLVGAGRTGALSALAPTQWGKTIYAAGETDDPRSWLRAADLMLLPSRYEGQSVAVSEALACGLPVVAFDVNGARAAITREGDAAGAVVPVGDAPALLAEARRRVQEPCLRAAEAIVARARAERDSRPSLVFDRVLGVYEAAIAAHQAQNTRP